ncbi:uracil/xanthine transporter [Peribacillus muralis]|uniref:uracil/xanthine transporter n=1 Tax=Peribacillus muralis TaxID=264697 RepID=UPI001F4E730F|nr:uracil/xanthine transporter [Peribacillus muralis]MCK1992290.1 uracil/xanthine transporter [Peribacillus muralis]MCK2012846.1 uracil/xanthine transporter [Peribacillus muralis]
MKSWGSSVTLFSSFQWLFFIFANTVVVPISIGAAFDLPADVTEMTMRSSLVFTGIACVIQGWKGHKYPIMEGHSGLLWGVMLNLGLSAPSIGLGYAEIGGGIATGLLAAGVVTMIIAAFNLISYVQKIFTPMVMTVYLFLLTFQLIFVFFKGMLGITDAGEVNIPVSFLSLGIVLLVSILKIKGPRTISNFSILIGIIVGWIFYALLFPATGAESVPKSASFSLFPLGMPNLEFGIIAIAFFAGLLNLCNTFASIQAASEVLGEESNHKQYRNSIFLTGGFTILASLLGLVPYTPFTSSIGFLQSTQIYERRPFLLGGVLLAVIGLIPPFISFLATMPITVGNAVLFVAYLQLFGTAFNSVKGQYFTSDTIFRLAVPVLIGVSLMNVLPSAFANVPTLLQPFLTNGLIMGVLISIVLEKSVNWKRFEQVEN